MELGNEQLRSGEKILWPQNCERLEFTEGFPCILTNRRFLEKREDLERETGVKASEIFSQTEVQVSKQSVSWSINTVSRVLILKGSRPGVANLAIAFEVAGKRWWRQAFVDITYKEYKEFKSHLKNIHPKFIRLMRDGESKAEMLYGGSAAMWFLSAGFIFALLFGIAFEEDKIIPMIGIAWAPLWLTLGVESFVTGITWVILIKRVIWQVGRIVRIFLIWLIIHSFAWGVGFLVFTMIYFPSTVPWAIIVLVVGCVFIGSFWSLHTVQIKHAEALVLILRIFEGILVMGIGFLFMICFTSNLFGMGIQQPQPNDAGFLVFIISLLVGTKLFDTLLTHHKNKQEDKLFLQTLLTKTES